MACDGCRHYMKGGFCKKYGLVLGESFIKKNDCEGRDEEK